MSASLADCPENSPFLTDSKYCGAFPRGLGNDKTETSENQPAIIARALDLRVVVSSYMEGGRGFWLWIGTVMSCAAGARTA
jgi:hypothetical protein